MKSIIVCTVVALNVGACGLSTTLVVVRSVITVPAALDPLSD
jgi:hypothetical protein